MKLARPLFAASVAGVLALALCATALAGTVANGSKILCVIGAGINSSTLTPGTVFKLAVDDPGQPRLAGAAIHGHVTSVAAPAGLTRASIAFVFDYIKFKNGTREPIHAQVLSRNVSQTNTATMQKEQIKLSLPPMPNGTVTPGPIAWQMHFTRGSAPSVTPPPTGSTGGVVYAQQPNEPIVIPPGSPVTLQLTADLTTP